jgi:hypothetical protein
VTIRALQPRHYRRHNQRAFPPDNGAAVEGRFKRVDQECASEKGKGKKFEILVFLFARQAAMPYTTGPGWGRLGAKARVHQVASERK